MQQYFIDKEINTGDTVLLDSEILFHLRQVLRKKNAYTFRLVDAHNNLFLAELSDDKAIIKERIEEDRELDIDVTIILSLIKNDKFDFCLQKLTELGVTRIVPYEASRSIIKIKDKKAKLDRYRKIVKEASEQSLRSYTPIIDDIIDIKSLGKYKSKYNYVAYEKNFANYIPYRDIDESVTVIIGPEGGFELQEIDEFEKTGFECVSLGKRILRAETAALYVMSNISGAREK